MSVNLSVIQLAEKYNSQIRNTEPNAKAERIINELQTTLLRFWGAGVDPKLLLPARRQQEYRSVRISSTCAVKRPDSVPAEGLYHPAVALSDRERNYQGDMDDNYLYKTYQHDGRDYPQGVWVLEVRCGRLGRIKGS
jgi:hypothetical protein